MSKSLMAAYAPSGTIWPLPTRIGPASSKGLVEGENLANKKEKVAVLVVVEVEAVVAAVSAVTANSNNKQQQQPAGRSRLQHEKSELT